MLNSGEVGIMLNSVEIKLTAHRSAHRSRYMKSTQKSYAVD